MRAFEAFGRVWVLLQVFQCVLNGLLIICKLLTIYIDNFILCSWPWFKVTFLIIFFIYQLPISISVAISNFVVKLRAQSLRSYRLSPGLILHAISAIVIYLHFIMAYNSATSNAKEMLLDNLNRYSTLVTDLATVFVVVNKASQAKRIGEDQLIDLLYALGILESLVELTPMEFPAYNYIRFANKEAKSKFLTEFTLFDDCDVVMADTMLNERLIKFSITWMPLYVINLELQKLLQAFGEVIIVKPTVKKISESISYQTSPVYVTFKMNKEISIEQIPYSLNASGNYRGWIHIARRKKVCFRCLFDTHTVRECNYRWCRFCKSFQIKEHSCLGSYSGKLKGLSQTDTCEDSVGAHNRVDSLEKKIASTKEQLNKLTTEKLIYVTTPLEVMPGELNATNLNGDQDQDLLAQAILAAKLSLEEMEFQLILEKRPDSGNDPLANKKARHV